MPAPAHPYSPPPRARLIAVGAACFLALGALYGGAIQTQLGQHLDGLTLEAQRPPRDLPAIVTSLSLHALALVVVVGLAMTRWFARATGHPRLASMAAWLVLGTAILAEGAKALLPRPSLDPSSLGPSFPSGHTSAAMALGLALLLVAPHPLRRALHVGVPFFAGSVAAGVVVLGWHRPSDALGGILLSLGWGAVVLASWTHGPRRSAQATSPVSRRFAEPRRRRAAFLPFAAAGALVLTAEGLLALSGKEPLLGAATALTALAAAGAVTVWEHLVEPLVDTGRLR